MHNPSAASLGTVARDQATSRLQRLQQDGVGFGQSFLRAKLDEWAAVTIPDRYPRIGSRNPDEASIPFHIAEKIISQRGLINFLDDSLFHHAEHCVVAPQEIHVVR